MNKTRIRTLSLFAIALFLVFTACKKSSSSVNAGNGTAAADSVAILGKWSLVSHVTWSYDQNGKLIDHGFTVVSPADSIYFNTNGKAYQYQNDPSSGNKPLYDTIPYRVIDGHYLVAGPKLSDSAKISFGSGTLTMTMKALDTLSSPGNAWVDYDTLQYKR